MDSWIWQAGYPVISVTLDGDELVVRQRKFSFLDSSDDTTWMVPLSYRTASGTSSLLLSEDEQRVQVNTNGPVIVNAGGHAFVGSNTTTNYGRASWVRSCQLSMCSSATRWLMMQLLQLRRANLTHQIFSTCSPSSETKMPFRYGKASPQACASSLTSSVTPTNAQHSKKLSVISANPHCSASVPLQKMKTILSAHFGVSNEDRCLLSSDLRRSKSVVRSSTIQLPQRPILNCSPLRQRSLPVAATPLTTSVFRWLQDLPTPQEQLRNLYALAEFRDAELIAQTCELALSSEVRTQNAPFLLRACIANESNGSAAAIRRRSLAGSE